VKFNVGFIGDNTHAVIPQKCIANFTKKYKTHSNIKKRAVLDAIEYAMSMTKDTNLREIQLEQFQNTVYVSKDESNITQKKCKSKPKNFKIRISGEK
jgi:hypothetical protein